MTRLHPNPTGTVLVNTLAAIAALVVFFGVIHLAERDATAAAKLDALDAQAMNAEHRLQRAARALCIAEAGPGSQARWTPQGDLVCRPAEVTAQQE
jgi:hypothetical protein